MKVNYLLEHVIKRINSVKGCKEAKQDRIAYYTKYAYKLEQIDKQVINDYNFKYEVEQYQKRYDELKKVEKLVRHAYAPELNKLWYKDGTSRSVPGKQTILEAVGL